MGAILFQVIPNSEPNLSPGFPLWLFWLLVVIIIILFIFILIRDRGIRGIIKNFFAWIAKKIRVASIKAKINKKKQKRQTLVVKLGQKVWEKKIEASGSENEIAEIQKLKEDEIKIKDDIQKLDAEIEQNNAGIEELNKDKESKVSSILKNKNPLDTEFRALEKERDLLDREIKEKDKLSIKTAKSVRQQVQEIKRTENDEYLSKIEKEIKRKEFEKKITELKDEETKILSTLTVSRAKQTNLIQKTDDLAQKISQYEAELDRIGKEHENQLQEKEEVIETLKKNKNALNIKNIGLQKQLSLIFEKLGETINQSRVDSTELMGIYSQIDSMDKSISDLENRLK